MSDLMIAVLLIWVGIPVFCGAVNWILYTFFKDAVIEFLYKKR